MTELLELLRTYFIELWEQGAAVAPLLREQFILQNWMGAAAALMLSLSFLFMSLVLFWGTGRWGWDLTLRLPAFVLLVFSIIPLQGILHCSRAALTPELSMLQETLR